MKSSLARRSLRLVSSSQLSTVAVSPPRLFDYKTVTSNLKPSVAIIDAVEGAFAKLAKGQVDVPIPMHIGIHETPVRLHVVFKFDPTAFLGHLVHIHDVISLISRLCTPNYVIRLISDRRAGRLSY